MNGCERNGKGEGIYSLPLKLDIQMAQEASVLVLRATNGRRFLGRGLSFIEALADLALQGL